MLRCLETGMMWAGTMLCTREFLRICRLWTRSCRYVNEISQQPLSALVLFVFQRVSRLSFHTLSKRPFVCVFIGAVLIRSSSAASSNFPDQAKRSHGCRSLYTKRSHRVSTPFRRPCNDHGMLPLLVWTVIITCCELSSAHSSDM